MNKGQRPGQPPWQEQAGGGPPYDLVREGDWLVLCIALPGAGPGDFRISLVGNRQVHIDGTIPYRHPVPRDGLAMGERGYGPFSRTISLPLPVAAAGAGVQFDRGVLTARLPLQLQRLGLAWEGMEGTDVASSR